MKILVTVDKYGSAIHQLALMNAKYAPHHKFKIVPVHPKRPDERELQAFEEAYSWCEVWDAQYWKTAEMLRARYGEEFFTKPSVLTHHNPYDLLQSDWRQYSKVIVMNKTQQKVLREASLIPHAVDMNIYQWNREYTEEKSVLMVAARIEGKKGVLEVAQACKELGYKFYLVGRISSPEYFNEVAQAGSSILSFHQDIPEEELVNLYKRAAIHVCNSIDNFESGTLPILNAMATGVPVLTRNVGLVPDIYNEKNMVVREGESNDVEDLKNELKALMEDDERRRSMREEAWHSVRAYEAERRARAYSETYYSLVYVNPLVSVIVPVFGNAERFQENITALNKQTYPAIEIVVVSDGDESFDKLPVTTNKTLKYFRVGSEEKYGLGLARDYGVMEAEGKIIVFCDQRFIPAPEMVEEFVKNLKPKLWLFGNKGTKRNFVENVSCIYRQEFIDMGMGNQLIDAYGGMSQELRERSKAQGFRHLFVEKAVAQAEGSSHNRNKRKNEIRLMKQRLWKLNLN